MWSDTVENKVLNVLFSEFIQNGSPSINRCGRLLLLGHCRNDHLLTQSQQIHIHKKSVTQYLYLEDVFITWGGGSVSV